ncbi:MAG: DUF5591 domain-containing protein [Candidatus Altiarchaeota archaeon]|nr:DUF5591 domain-containing protein [Candidatus Altiarchaeota archaeon]
MSNLILNFGRCSHGKCIFCGYGRIRGQKPDETDVNRCFDDFFDTVKDEEVKIYGSGSFFDEKQMPKTSRKHFIKKCVETGVKKITLESRPEYVTAEVLSEFRDFELTVAVGLETSDNSLLEKLEKGYTREDFETAADLIHDAGQKVRAYLLVNPPYVKDPVKSLDDSVEYALTKSDSIVLINTIPHSSAPLMRLWLEGRWNFMDKREFGATTKKWVQNPKVEVDFETFKFKPNIPEYLRGNLKGVGEWYLTHPHFEVWQDYFVRWYQPPKDRILIFLPCSYKKPYSLSETHKGIVNTLGSERAKFHEVMLSNAGVIPREFEDYYPFNSYDWDEKLENETIKRRYIEVTTQRIEKYLAPHIQSYRGIVCFLKYGSESYKALDAACKNMNTGFKNLLSKETYDKIQNERKPLQTNEALKELRDGIKWCLQNST